MYAGIDLSKRSTAIVVVDKVGTLDWFKLICPSMDTDGEPLISYVWAELSEFLDITYVEKLAIEGLSFGSVGSGKDLLAGESWYVRTRLWVEFPVISVKVVPVLSWRARVIPIEERRLLKGMKSAAIKEATVAKLPFEVKVRFEDYIRVNSFKKTAMYDLADAYFISLFVGGFLGTK